MTAINRNLNGQRLVISCIIISCIVLVVLTGLLAGCAPANSKVLTHNLAEPLGEVTAAKFDINTGTGNLTIDRLTGGEPLLAGGTLEYLENQDLPERALVTFGSQATFSLKASGARQAGPQLPWEACNGETSWQLHLNPAVTSDILAHSGGGNVDLNLAGMAITRVAADTGGGNMTVTLPNNAANLDVTAKTGAGDVIVAVGSGLTGSSTLVAGSGAGNVQISLPAGTAARIRVTSGMGKVIMDPRFNQTDKDTYQSPDYDSAADKIEITLNSGAGNVSVSTK